MSDLIGVRAKVERADKHFRVFHRCAGRYFKTGNPTVAFDLNVQKDTLGVLYEFAPAPPLILSVLIGDFVHNLRSALDNLVCSLARINHPKTACSGLAFPICTSFDDYAEKRGTLLKGLPEQAKTLIDGLQPYARLDQLHPLAVLNMLSNRDKHRALVLTACHSRNTKVVFSENGKVVKVLDIHGPLKHGAPLLFTDIPAAIKPEMQVKVQGASGIAFEEIASWDYGLVEPALSFMLQFVQKEVIPRFEPFFDKPTNNA